MTVEPQLTLEEFVASRWEETRRWQEEVNQRLAKIEARLDTGDENWDRLEWWQTSVGAVLFLLATGKRVDEYIPWLTALEADRVQRVAAFRNEQSRQALGVSISGRNKVG